MSRHAIDMTNAPVSSVRNALGFQRNGPWFWRQLPNQKPNILVQRIFGRYVRADLRSLTRI